MTVLRFTVTDHGGAAATRDVTVNRGFPIAVRGDGTDESSSILGQVAAIPDGTVNDRNVALFPATPFRFESVLLLQDRNHLELRGFDLTATVSAPTGNTILDRTRAHIRTLRGFDLAIRNGKIKGPNPNAGTGEPAYVAALEAQHGVDISQSDGVEIANLTVNDIYGDFVYVGSGGRNVWAHHFTFDRNGRQGITVTNGQHVLVEDGSVANVRRSAFDLEPNFAADIVRDVKVRRCTVGAHRLNFLASKGVAAVMEDISFEDITGTAGFNAEILPPGTARRRNFSFVRCSTSAGYGAPSGVVLSFTNVDGLVVHDVHQPMQLNRNMYLLGVTNCTGVDLAGNSWPGGVGEVHP